MDDFRLELIAAPLGAAAGSLVLLPLLIRSGRLPQDRPNERSLHAVPVPRSGGLAIMLPALICGWLVAPELRLALGCAAALGLASFVDDLRPLPASLRLALHLAAAALFIYAGFASWNLLPAIAAVLAVVWMTNLYNFMDGSDGLAGGMAMFGFGCFAALAWLGGQFGFAAACATLAACAAAFLLFNFHPARIFMGDIGSIPLGFLAASLGLAGWDQGLWPLWLPLLVFSPFIVDASLTLARRLARGEKVWLAHRNHYYQRLVRMGLGHRNTALAEYGLMALAAGCALLMVGRSATVQFGLLAGWTVLYAVLAVAIDRCWSTFEESA